MNDFTMGNKDLNLSRRAFCSAAAAAAIMATLGLAGCGSSSSSSSSSTGSSTAKTADKTAARKVCFVEIVENDAFTSMMSGFKNEMSAKGYTNVSYDVKNAQGDSATLNQIAAQLKTSDYDVIVPIATPAAQACTNAEIEKPMVFISVTDPIAAGLTATLEKPSKGITGTSNFSPVDEIYQLGLELVPAIASKKVGILYCSGEKNAVVTVQKMEAYLQGIGKEYEEKAISVSSEAQQAAATLSQTCGCIYVPMDSVVQSAMTAVTDTATKAGVPVLGSDPVMVKSGALLSVACGNETIGSFSADLAIQVFEGTDVVDIPIMTVTQNDKVVSKTTAAALNITVPTNENIQVI